MKDNRKISVVIPYYNRCDLVIQTIEPLLSDDRISEVILCDDRSPDEDYYQLLKNVSGMKKVKVYRNVINMYVQANKKNALSFAKEDWVVIVDNDNIMSKDFFDKLFSIDKWDPDTIYHPSFASPNFDYRQFNGKTITKENVIEFTKASIFVTLCNTNNYMTNKSSYLKSYLYSSDIRGADGIFNSYNWLKNGNKIYIVPDLTYFHRVHDTSAFLSEADSNMKLIYYWLDKIKELK